MNNGTPLPEFAPPPAGRQIGVANVVHHGQQLIQVLILEGGVPVPGAAIAMTVEQAKQHTMQLVERIQMADGTRSKLILPGNIGGKPFQP